MALFDAENQKIVLRVVYDGPAGAGKTTNLWQLRDCFTAKRRSEVYTPAEIFGRTLFFDWLEVDSGIVGGYGLRCQFVTVPGQRALSRRRMHLLRKADAVVFVCESTPSGLVEAKTQLEEMRSALGIDAPSAERLVVQANKQDLAGALLPTAVAEDLALDPATRAVAARACSGIGVRETAVLAIRAAANGIQRRILEEGIEALLGEPESGEELLGAIVLEEEIAPMSPTDVVLMPSTLRTAAAATVPDAHEAPSGTDSRPSPASGPERSPAPQPPSSGESKSAPQGALLLPVRPQIPERQDTPLPPLPGARVPTGFIWPATGRDLLREITPDSARPRFDLVGRQGTDEGSGTSDAVIVEAGPLCLKTSQRRRYSDADDGRAALLGLARRKLLLGDLLPENTVLAVQVDDRDNSAWLWTITPWLTTLRALMARAAATADQAALGAALACYARAAVRSLTVTLRHGVVLDIHPSNFALGAQGPVYIDDDIVTGSRSPSIGYALLRRAEEYAPFPEALDTYLFAFGEVVRENLSTRDVERLDLVPALEQSVVRSQAARDARESILTALGACGEPGSRV